MTTTQDPIAHAARLLRETAEELRQEYTLSSDRNNWIGEPEAKAAYDEHMAAAQALEDWEAAMGAGGVQALSAVPAGWKLVPAGWKLVPVEPTNDMQKAADEWAAKGFDWPKAVYRAMLAASPTPTPTPTAEQTAITPETGNSASAKGAAITSESGAVYASKPDSVAWLAEYGGDIFTAAQLISYADRTHALRMEQAAPKAAPGEMEESAAKGAIMGAAYDFRDAHISGSINLKRSAHAALEAAVDSALAAHQQEPSQDTMYLLRRLLSNQHTLTGPEFRAELEKIVGEAYQQEAQEPSRAAKTWCSYVAGMIGCYLNEPDESTKVQAIAGIIERRLWALPTPQPAPAPLSEREAFEVAWEKLHGKRPVLWSRMFAEHKMETPSHSEGNYFARDEQAAWKLWQARAALAAQGGE